MEDEALEYSFELFQNDGYTGSKDQYSALLKENPEAVEYSYGLFKNDGYGGTLQDFQSLMGIVEPTKKKEDTELQLVDGSLAQPTIQAPKIDTQPEVETQTVVETTKIPPEEDPDLPVTVEDISKDEEFIVPKLNYKFKNDGFVFEETGLTDNVKVTAPNNETITIGLDAFTTAQNREERDRLNKFIDANKQDTLQINKAIERYDYKKMIFENQKDVQERMDALKEESNAFEKNIQSFLYEQSVLEEEGKALQALSEQQRRLQKDRIDKYNQEMIRLNKSYQQIQNYYKDFEFREKQLNAAVGEYYDMKRSQGSMAAGIVDQILRGAGEIGAGVVDIAIDLRTSQVDDKKKKEFKEKVLPPIREFFVETFGGKDVSEQWMMAQQEKFFPGAFLGLARSLPALLLPGGSLVRLPALFAQVNSQYQEEFKDLDLTENEKTLLKVPLAAVTAVLENFGFRNVLGNSSLVKRLLLNVAKKVPTNANASVLNDFIRNEIKSKLGRAGSRLTSAALAEAETGALQQTADIGGKELFEFLKGKDLFQTPEGVTEILSEIAYAAGQEAVGGFVLGTLPAISDAYASKDFTRVDKEVLNMFNNIRNDGFTKKAFVQQQKQRIEKGEITKEEAQNELENFDKAAGLANQIPTDISVEKQQQILGLLASKQELQNEKADKDPATVGNIDQQIQQIDNQIEQVLSQEQTVEEPIPDFVEEQEQEEATYTLPEDPKEARDDFEVIDNRNEKEGLEIEKDGSGKWVVRNKKTGRIIYSKTKKDAEFLATKDGAANWDYGEGAPLLEQTQTQLTEEQQDIDAFFGEEVEETTETVASNLSVNRAGKTVEKGAEQIQRENNVTKIARTAASAIKNLLPNTRIVIHENESEYLKFAAPGRGELIGDTIHINLSKATATTVPHEVFHAVFLNKIKTDPKAAEVAEKMMMSVRKTLSNDSELARRIDTFAESYKDVSELQNEERLAELIGIMASEYKTLTKPQKNIVIKFIEDLARTLGVDLKLSDFTKTDNDVIDLLNTLSTKVATGEEIQESDIEILESGDLLEQEQGEGGQVGTVEITEQKRRSQKAPSVSNDTRSFASLIQEKSLTDFNGQNFVTNMYDFTNAGPTEIAPGIVLQLDGGKSYVPLMMERQGLKLGDKSNLAAFNSQAQAETFIRNSQQGNANLFMPHVGTKEGSWQFQQNLLEQLTDAALQNNILSNREIINTFNEGLSNKEGLKAFDIFKKRLGRNIKNFNIFRDNPKQLIELLDINNNYSPDLRKILNDKLSANKKYQEAVGVKNKLDFVGKFEDPLNVGSVAGDLVSIIEFDNKTFEVSKPNIGDVDYHPSFAFTIKANINGIYQPTEFFQSSNVTKKYLKYNQKAVTVSEKKVGRETEFDRANVKSSAGSIPKVATAELVREQRRQQRLIDKSLSEASGTTQVATTKGSYEKVARKIAVTDTESTLDYGAGLGLGTDAMSNILGTQVDSFELNTDRWKGKTPPTYTKAEDITKTYDNVVSLNVLNVVPANVRDFIVKDIASKLNPGGRAYISTRKFKGDIDNAKNFELGPEEKSYIIKRKQGNEVIDVYQKGFDGNELVVYIEETLGPGFEVQKDNSFGSSGVIITQKDTVSPRQRRQQRTIEQVAQQYNMDNQGFIPKTANLSQLRKAVAPFGLEARRARVDQFGRGGGLFLVRDGRKFNPFAQTTRRRQQRTPADYIREGREAGFRDELIVDYLKRVQKLRVKDIKELMGLDSETLGALPESFKNIKGGAKAGLKLFNKIDLLIIKEKKLNNRRKNKLTDAQIMDKAVAFLENQVEYKNEADTYKVKGETKARKTLSTQQALMLSDLQKTLNQRPTKDIAFKIRAARALVRARSKGQRDLQKVKRELRNFMRKTLPPAIFTKKEALQLVQKIEQATNANIENIMEEVIDLATAKNNVALQNKINKILTEKYEVLVSGRKKPTKIDLDTRKRIEAINNNVLPPTATEEEISDKNEALNREFLELAQDPNQDPFVVNKMVDLQIAINLNNASLLENTDANKTLMLDQAFDALSGMVQFGRSVLKAQIEAQAQEYRRQFAELYYDITGNKLNLDDPDLNEQLENEKFARNNETNRRKVKNRAATLVRNIMRSIDTGVIGTAEALDGLMDRISSLPGELFGGRAQVLVTDKIDAASREFKKRRLVLSTLLDKEMANYLGANWRKRNKEFSQLQATGIYKNPDRVAKAQQEYDKDPKSVDKKQKLDKVINEEEIYQSQNQLYYMYNQFKDPANRGAFEAMYGEQTDRIMEEIENYIDPDLKRFADWQVNVLYPTLYTHYNEAYKKIYRTDLPMNKYYAGYLVREGTTPNDLDLLGDQGIMQTAVGSASTKARSRNNKKIVYTDGTTALTSYIDDMEYFAAYSSAIRDINKLFTNQYIKDAIRNIHGQKINDLIDDAIKKLANRGKEKHNLTGFLDGTNTVFLISRLGINPVIMIKQLTSLFTYANDIGIVNWLKYAAKNKSQQLQVFKEIRENSVYMQDRNNNSILRQIENYSEKDANKVLPLGARTKDWIVNFLMAQVIVGDRTAIMLGGAPNYSYYKDQFKKNNPNATEQEAIDHAIIKFERDTKRTQQSSDLQDKDYYQQKGPLSRAANMFLTTPKQYLRKEIQAVRALNRKLLAWDRTAGKGTIGENIRTFVMYHIFMPVLFQYVTLGLPGLLREFRDDDDEDLWRAGILGNLNALFILGEVFTIIGDKLTGKPWTSSKDVGILAIAKSLSERYQRAARTKDVRLKAQYMNDFYLELAQTTGLPLLTVKKLVNNYTNVLDSKDMGEAILRLFNFSEYAIKGRKKRQRSSRVSDKELKMLFPELYDELKEENQEVDELEKELKDLEKELLEDLYK